MAELKNCDYRTLPTTSEAPLTTQMIERLAPVNLQAGRTSPPVAANLGAAVTIPNAGATLANSIPRYGYPNSIAAALDSNNFAGYGIGLAIQAAYGTWKY